MKKTLFIAACMATKGEEVFLKSKAFLANSKDDAYKVAYMNCHCDYPLEEGFDNHLASVGEIPAPRLRNILFAANAALN
jgi:hypothetical protein